MLCVLGRPPDGPGPTRRRGSAHRRRLGRSLTRRLGVARTLGGQISMRRTGTARWSPLRKSATRRFVEARPLGRPIRSGRMRLERLRRRCRSLTRCSTTGRRRSWQIPWRRLSPRHRQKSLPGRRQGHVRRGSRRPGGRLLPRSGRLILRPACSPGALPGGRRPPPTRLPTIAGLLPAGRRLAEAARQRRGRRAILGSQPARGSALPRAEGPRPHARPIRGGRRPNGAAQLAPAARPSAQWPLRPSPSSRLGGRLPGRLRSTGRPECGTSTGCRPPWCTRS